VSGGSSRGRVTCSLIDTSKVLMAVL
jgi:hypothetical protein